MAGAGTVWVDVRADTTGFLGDIRRAVSGLEGGRGVLLGAAAGTAAVGAGLGLIATKAVDASTEFNKSMSAVAATADATASELDLLSDAALKAGASTSFSASEAATAQAELARAGLSTTDILEGALGGALDLAAAGQLDLADAAVTTAQALNTFNLEGDQATRVADVLAAGANKSAADVGSLSLALSQGGLVAKQTGLSLEETVGVLSLFADNALVGSDAGTSLKTALQRLVPQSAEAKQAMDDLGLSFFDAAGNFVGIEETAQRLQTALSGLSTEQRQAALTTMFGSDAIRAIGLLYEAGAAGVRDYTAAVDDQGAAQRTAAKMLDNLAGDIEELSGAWETFLIGLGQEADSGLRDLVQGATGVVQDLGEALSSGEFDEFFARVEQIGAVLGDVLAAGWDVARVAFDGAASAADVLLPLVGGLADGLEVLADQAWLVQGALAAWAASNIVDLLSPVGQFFSRFATSLAALEAKGAALRLASSGLVEIGSAANAATAGVAGVGVTAAATKITVDELRLALASLYAEFMGIKALGAGGGIVPQTTPVVLGELTTGAEAAAAASGRLSARIGDLAERAGNVARGALSTLGDALTGLLTGANLLTAGIAAGFFIYQDWKQETEAVEQATDDLTRSLQEQMDVQASALGRRKLVELIGDSDVFVKAGTSLNDLTKIVADAPGAFDRFNDRVDGWLGPLENIEADLPGAVADLRDSTKGLSGDVQAVILNWIALLEQHKISADQFRELIEITTTYDKAVSGSIDSMRLQAEQFRIEAKGKQLSAEAQRQLNTAIESNDMEKVRDALAFLAEKYPELADGIIVSTATVEDDTSAKQDNTTATTENAAAQRDLADGYKVMSDAAREALDDVLGFFDAQDGYESALEDQAKARKKLADIESGASEGLTSARRALIDADKALTDAIEQQAEDIADAERKVADAKDRLAEALEKGGATGTGGVEGARVKPDFSVAREIGAAQRDLAAAERELNDLRVNGSDAYRNALQRQRDAQAKVNEEAAKVGPQSEAAADARDELEAANRRVIDAELSLSDAMGKVSKEDIPAAIEGLQALGAKHADTKNIIDEQIGSLLALAALYQNFPEVTTPAPPRVRGRVPTRDPDRRLGGGRANGGPVWADSVHPVVERGLPEMFSDQRGNTFLLPPAGGGVVAPLTPGGSDDLIAALDRVAGQLIQLNARPNEVRIDSINQYGIRDGSPSEMSRALADAGFAPR